MRILLVTHYFPPYDHIGSARTGKTAKYLERFGHDVRVLAARDTLTPFATMPVEIPADHVVYTPWISWFFRTDLALNRLAQRMRGASARDGSRAAAHSPPVEAKSDTTRRESGTTRAGKRIRDALRTVFYFPDAQIGWLPFAIRAGRQLLKTWQADVILASSGPYTALIIANRLSREFDIPWVAEFRDLWVENHQYQHPDWRRTIEARLEQTTVSTASGLVTVSEPLAERLRETYSADVEVVYNGFDPGDHGQGASGSNAPYLSIVYTGWVYPQHTLAPLFEAVHKLALGPSDVRIIFYRADATLVREVAAKFGVAEMVETRAGVEFMESLRLQREADVLLYLSWNDPAQTGIFSGKLLQYFGAGRPILAVGSVDNAPARVIIDRQLGFASADSGEIAKRISGWIAEKRDTGKVKELPPQAAAVYSRENQTRRLERFLADVAATRRTIYPRAARG
ncbi:MAG: glycosyltransferase [Gemmatimonadaceae bacterium]